jgi:hypothetical protein
MPAPPPLTHIVSHFFIHKENDPSMGRFFYSNSAFTASHGESVRCTNLSTNSS